MRELKCVTSLLTETLNSLPSLFVLLYTKMSNNFYNVTLKLPNLFQLLTQSIVHKMQLFYQVHGSCSLESEYDGHDGVGRSLHNAHNPQGWDLELLTEALIHGLPTWLKLPQPGCGS